MFFSKLFQRKLWWFCGISTGYKGSKPKESLSKFFVAPASVRPRSERRRATFRRLGRSDPSVFSGSSCCGTAGRTFRPSLNLVSQNSSIAQIRFQRKLKGESVVGQFEFSTSNRRKPQDRRGRNAPNMAVQPMVAATPKQTFS